MKRSLIIYFAALLNAVSASLLPGYEDTPWFLQLPISGTADMKTGSGFVMTTSNRVFLVTAKHVLFDVKAGTQPLPLISTNLVAVGWNSETRDSLTINLGACRDANNVRYSDRDVAVVCFATIDPSKPLQWGMDNRYVTYSGRNMNAKWMSVGVARRFVDVRVAEDVFTFGYPTSIGSQLLQTKQLDPTRRLAKKGIIADKDSVRRRFVLDLPVYFGNSGGPVIAIRDTGNGSYENHLIGIVSEFVPFEDVWVSKRYQLGNVTWGNSGYSIAEPIDYAMELLW